MSDNYCANCGKNVPIWIRHRAVTLRYGKRRTTYDELYAICQFCNEEVYSPKINGMNIIRWNRVLSEEDES